MKSKSEIRKETPLSVTSTDNAIFKVKKDCKVKVYDVMKSESGMFGYWTLNWIYLKAGSLLRLLQCDDDEKDNHYRIGEANQKVIIPDSNMDYVSGNMGPRA